MAAKRKPSDELEREVRAAYIPTQIASVLAEVLAIEVNAKWCATKSGKAQQIEKNGYSEDQLSKVIEKQEGHRQELLVKLAFLKDLLDAERSTLSAKKK